MCKQPSRQLADRFDLSLVTVMMVAFGLNIQRPSWLGRNAADARRRAGPDLTGARMNITNRIRRNND